MLTLGKFSGFSVTTLMFVNSVALKTHFTSKKGWVRYCEGEFSNHTSIVFLSNLSDPGHEK